MSKKFHIEERIWRGAKTQKELQKEATMPDELDGKYIKEAYYFDPRGSLSVWCSLGKKEDFKYRYHSEYFGDHSENWVVILRDNVEVARYNARFLSHIIWEEDHAK